MAAAIYRTCSICKRINTSYTVHKGRHMFWCTKCDHQWSERLKSR